MINDSKNDALVLEGMKDFVSKNGFTGRNSWCAAVRDKEGNLSLFEARSRPCYGELRRYEDGTRPEDDHPGDLPNPIDKGMREAVGLPFFAPFNKDVETHNQTAEFLFSDESPWRRGLRPDSIEFVDDEDGRHVGMVMTETDVDPTVMVALFMFLRDSFRGEAFNEGVSKHGMTKMQALVYSVWVRPYANNFEVHDPYDYVLHESTDLKRFVTGDSADLSRGKTWRDEEDYNRPFLPEIFFTKNTVPFATKIQEHLGGKAVMYGSFNKKKNDNFSRVIEFIKSEVPAKTA